MRLLTRLASVPAALATLAVSGGTVIACAFHAYAPEETPVDKMLGSDHIVLAKQDPNDPFRFVAVSAIRGSLDDVELPHLVDSVSRRKLGLNPDDAVLFARLGSYGPWERLAYLDEDYRELVAAVALRLEDWQYGGDEERFQMFADRHQHENPDIRQLALSELDRAPYDLLRNLRFDPDASLIARAMYRPEMADFMPIHVLLLGLSGDDAARDLLNKGMDEALIAQTSVFIGAWATALIELDGTRAVDQLAQRLRADETLLPDTREALIEAFAIHSQAGDPEVQQYVVETVSSLLAEDAMYAGMVARQMGSRGDWSQAETLATLKENGQLRSATALISVSHYLSFAQDAAALTATTSN
ncbi:MAG: hypothetical protein AB3N23_06050 [Paracoccaceae bacterium]